ncbi:hypothetical protein [Myroides odoratimimus]|uniref:hypothetical protein n=2 Tax=Myroides odoratimimus TaxID=76832 RepID=UPI0025774EB7|nr:hypothetical protein [Myroides odoratimimus]MDM1537490.1 hypothetical protein [Myroides odoratimimus]MDM1677042.1 hypothetical protein [Myroides odoratimimus]
MINWLNHRYGTSFTENNIQSIKDFSLIWNLFEGKFFETSFSIDKLEKILIDTDIDIYCFLPYLEYFKNRYVNQEDNTINERFSFLHFRKKDREDFVTEVLLNNENILNYIETNTQYKVVLAISIIVYRFRNNLFHGVKNIQHIDQQEENFVTANDFLRTIIETIEDN